MVRICRLFVFFQAEDGIRDIGVTGVQTCALPICIPLWTSQRGNAAGLRGQARYEIGRASCRERGVDLGGRRIIKKKKKRDTKMMVKITTDRWVTTSGEARVLT